MSLAIFMGNCGISSRSVLFRIAFAICHVLPLHPHIIKAVAWLSAS